MPDIFIYSTSSKRCIIGELTCPWEDNSATSNDNKMTKYKPLVNMLSHKGYEVKLFCFAVGSRGFVDCSLSTFLQFLGFSKTKTEKVRRLIARIVITCSYTIYLHRSSQIWSNFNLINPFIPTVSYINMTLSTLMWE